MKSFKRLLPTVAALALLAGAAHAQHYVNVDKQGLALEGYDPVAYFTDHKPVQGKKEFSAEHDGATYYFASAEHQSMFEAEPGKYAPQFGGFCAYAVSKGYVAPVNPSAFQIHDGHLLLQNSSYAMELFNQDEEGNYKAAVANWPKIAAKKAR